MLSCRRFGKLGERLRTRGHEPSHGYRNLSNDVDALLFIEARSEALADTRASGAYAVCPPCLPSFSPRAVIRRFRRKLDLPLKRARSLLNRLLLLVLLVLASMPTGATETVCVLESRKAAVPLGKCGMPCCAPPANASALTRRSSCCLPKEPARRIAPNALCRMAGAACRCETRLVAAPSPVAASGERAIAARGSFPVVLVPEWRPPFASAPLTPQSGIAGSDAGPPRKRPRAPAQSRAPPART